MIEKVCNIVVPPVISSKMYEVAYFTDSFKARSKEEQFIVKNVQSYMMEYQLGGIALGLALSLSLRRYVVASSISSQLQRIPVYLALICAGQYLSSVMAADKSLMELGSLRKDLVLESHSHYLRHLQSKYNRYGILYHNQESLFSDIMTQECYHDWLNKTKFNLTFFRER